MYGPVLQGTLVRLRPPQPDEAAVIIKWFEDLEVTRFLKLRHPPSLQAEQDFLEKMAQDPNAVYWVVEHEGKIVGGTSIVRIDWTHGFGSTGTVIGVKTAWAKGLGTELMQLRARYAFTQLPLRKLKSSYIEGNEGSARAQGSAGYRPVGRYSHERWVDGAWRDLVLTEVLREDWLKEHAG